MEKKFNLDVFIKGELIDLCIPTVEYARDSDWYSLFNNPIITKYLEQGIFPNIREDEVSFFQNERGKRLILIVVDKKGVDFGVISLSFINYAKRTADMALVLNDTPHDPFAGLEAMALLLEHAFTKLGMERIHIGQHEGLMRWQRMCELIGFKVEGILEKGFIKGRERSCSISSAALVEDFDRIISNRGGHLWDSRKKMKERITKLPQIQFAQTLFDFFKTERDNYYNNIFKL